MQLGFDLEYTDPHTGEMVPWAEPTPELLQTLRNAPWKLLDVETTGLNPASKEQSFGAKDIRRGVRPELRLRVVSVYYPMPMGAVNPLERVSFDLDKMSTSDRFAVVAAAYSGDVFGWNVGFDAYWCLATNPRAKAKRLIDLMLCARVLRPQHPLEMARMANDDNEHPDLRDTAIDMFRQGRGGWALRDVAANVLRIALDKSSQGPKNWCEPFLSQKSYDYAVGDTVHAHDIGMLLFGAQEGEDLLAAYERCKAADPVLRMVEPQVADIISMRVNGMPWNVEAAERYVAKQWAKVKEYADKMVELVPSLEAHRFSLGNAEAGVTADLKAAIGKAFSERGIELETTSKTGAFKIGEKDLRRVRAETSPDAKLLFDTWVGLNRAKKAGGMAREVSGYAIRSGDGHIHPNTGHGPVTGRLASSEPNAQQFPRDQGFRDCVAAPEGHDVVASDYSALDMRVGAALAIRAQQQIFEAYMGDRVVPTDVLRCISRVFEKTVTFEAARALELKAMKEMAEHKLRKHEADESSGARKAYWDTWRRLSRTLLLSSFQRCLAEVRVKAESLGTPEWGSLRDAFSIAGMDIHTWTALGMLGKDPLAMFSGKPDDEVASLLKANKKELGDKRQTGKVGNLSLLYAMKSLGLQEAAAKNYNIHWTLEEADKVRNDWLAAYVEIDLWHKWTELNPVEEVYVPDPDRGGDFRKKQVYESYTLGGRLIYAFGLNAALSYEDQSTGADILGTVMKNLRERHPQVFACTVNQVHDELVFVTPSDKTAEYTDIIQGIMTECAEMFLMPFGVRGECSPAIGRVWLKD